MRFRKSLFSGGKIRLALIVALPVLLLATFFVYNRGADAQTGSSWVRMDTGHSSHVYLVSGSIPAFDWSGSGIPSNARAKIDFVSDSGEVINIHDSTEVSWGRALSPIPNVSTVKQGNLRIRVYGRYNNTLYAEDLSDKKVVIIPSGSNNGADLSGPFSCDGPLCFFTTQINDWEVGKTGFFKPLNAPNLTDFYIYTFGQSLYGVDYITGFPFAAVSYKYNSPGVYTVSSLRVENTLTPPLPVVACSPAGCLTGLFPGGSIPSGLSGSIKTFYIGMTKQSAYSSPDLPDQISIKVNVNVKTNTIYGPTPISIGGVYFEYDPDNYVGSPTTDSCAIVSATLDDPNKITRCQFEFLTTNQNLTSGDIKIWLNGGLANKTLSLNKHFDTTAYCSPVADPCSIRKNTQGAAEYTIEATLDYKFNNPLHNISCALDKIVYMDKDGAKVDWAASLLGEDPLQVYELSLTYPTDSSSWQLFSTNTVKKIIYTPVLSSYYFDKQIQAQATYTNPGEKISTASIKNITPGSDGYGQIAECSTTVNVMNPPNISLEVSGKGKVLFSHNSVYPFTEGRKTGSRSSVSNVYTGYDPFSVVSTPGKQAVIVRTPAMEYAKSVYNIDKEYAKYFFPKLSVYYEITQYSSTGEYFFGDKISNTAPDRWGEDIGKSYLNKQTEYFRIEKNDSYVDEGINSYGSLSTIRYMPKYPYGPALTDTHVLYNGYKNGSTVGNVSRLFGYRTTDSFATSTSNFVDYIVVPKDTTIYVDFVGAVEPVTYDIETLDNMPSFYTCESGSSSQLSSCNYAGSTKNIGGLIGFGAYPAIGEVFVGWSSPTNACKGQNFYCFIEYGDQSYISNGEIPVKANFATGSKLKLTVTGPGKVTLADPGALSGNAINLSNQVCEAGYGQTKVCEFISYEGHNLTFIPSGKSATGEMISYGPWIVNGEEYSDPEKCIYNGPNTVSDCKITITAGETTVSKTFSGTPNGPTLTTQVIGQGTISLAPAPAAGEASCASNTTCTVTYVNGSRVVITATPNTGETFIGWESTCNTANGATANASTKTCTIASLTADKSITAKFSGSASTDKTLTLKVVGPGSIKAKQSTTSGFPSVAEFSCDNSSATTDTAEKVCTRSDFPVGLPMIITMNKASGVEFVGYTGDCTGGLGGTVNSCTLTLDTNKSVCAGFAKNGGIGCGDGDDPPDGQIDLKLSIDGVGTVNVSKSSTPNIVETMCTNSDPTRIVICSIRKPEGTSLKLTPIAMSNSGSFDGWSGNCTGNSSCTLVMNLPTPKNVTAKFNQPANPSCSVTISPTGSLSAGQTVTFNGVVNNPNLSNYDYFWSWRDISPEYSNLNVIPDDGESVTVTNTYSSNGTYVRRFSVTETSRRTSSSNPKTVTCDATVQIGPVVGAGLGVTCDVNPKTNVFAGVTQVIWSANVSGQNGSGSYRFEWTGDQGLNGRNTATTSVTYTTPGTKTGNVQVTDLVTNATAQCSSGPLSINVVNDPGNVRTLNMTVSGNGQVTMPGGAVCRSQAGGGANTCSETFEPDEEVTIIAEPGEGTNFLWSGSCSLANDPKSTSCNLTMDANKTAGVNFSAPGFVIDVGGGKNPLSPDLITVRNPRPTTGGNTEFTTDSVEFDVSLNGGANLESLNFELVDWDGLDEVVCGSQTCFNKFGAPVALFNGNENSLTTNAADQPIVFRLRFPNRGVDEALDPNALSPYRQDSPRNLTIRITGTILTDSGEPVTQSVNATVRFRFLDSRDTPPGQ